MLSACRQTRTCSSFVHGQSRHRRSRPHADRQAQAAWLAGLHAGRAARCRAGRGRSSGPASTRPWSTQVIGGCVTQAGEQSNNMVRRAWLHAGLPHTTGSTVIDAQCSSAQQATHLVDALIAAGAIKAGIACGVESMTRVPLGANVPRRHRLPAARRLEHRPAQPVRGRRPDRRRDRGFTREEVDAFGAAVAGRRPGRARTRAASTARSSPVEAPVLDEDGKPTGETQVVDTRPGHPRHHAGGARRAQAGARRTARTPPARRRRSPTAPRRCC